MNRRERRNKQMNRSLGEAPVDHAKYVRNYKYKVMKVIRDIEAGTVSEEDLARLRNYCQMSLRLMEKSPMTAIQAAWRDVEINALFHNAVEDLDEIVEDKGVVLKDGTQVAIETSCELLAA
jgi:hypothetical protein